MKIRNGFVSNSSSSSFIIYVCDRYPNVFELAKTMIPAREYKNDKKLIKKINESNIDKNTSVFFRSCNYDTFIIKRDDNYYVKTCNNHDWKCVIDSQAYNKTISEDEIDDNFNFKNEIFWFVENNKFIKDIDIYHNEEFKNKAHYCSECGLELYEFDGIIGCPRCILTIDELTFIRNWQRDFYDLKNKLPKDIVFTGKEKEFKINNFFFKRKKAKIYVYENSKKIKCNIRKMDDINIFLLSQKVKSIKKL